MPFEICIKIIYLNISVTNRIKPPKHCLYYEEGGPSKFKISAFKEMIFISARKTNSPSLNLFCKVLYMTLIDSKSHPISEKKLMGTSNAYIS